jgi:hypothetical protein
MSQLFYSVGVLFLDVEEDAVHVDRYRSGILLGHFLVEGEVLELLLDF